MQPNNYPAPADCTFEKLVVQLNVTPLAMGDTISLVVTKNGAPTALVLNLVGPVALHVPQIVNASVPFVEGDRYDISVTGSSNDTQPLSATIKYGPP